MAKFFVNFNRAKVCNRGASFFSIESKNKRKHAKRAINTLKNHAKRAINEQEIIMEVFYLTAEQMAVLFGFMLAGFILRKSGAVSDGAHTALSRTATFVFMPALVLSALGLDVQVQGVEGGDDHADQRQHQIPGHAHTSSHDFIKSSTHYMSNSFAKTVLLD